MDPTSINSITPSQITNGNHINLPKTPSNHIDNIPKELIIEIFKLIKPKDSSRLFLVSKKWNVYANDILLWKIYAKSIGIVDLDKFIERSMKIDPNLLTNKKFRKYYFKMENQLLNYQNRFGDMLYSKILELPIHGIIPRIIPNEFLMLNTIVDEYKALKTSCFFKIFVGSNLDLCLVYLPLDENETIIRFNSKFDINISDKQELVEKPDSNTLYWTFDSNKFVCECGPTIINMNDLSFFNILSPLEIREQEVDEKWDNLRNMIRKMFPN